MNIGVLRISEWFGAEKWPIHMYALCARCSHTHTHILEADFGVCGLSISLSLSLCSKIYSIKMSYSFWVSLFHSANDLKSVSHLCVCVCKRNSKCSQIFVCITIEIVIKFSNRFDWQIHDSTLAITKTTAMTTTRTGT